MCVTIVRAVTGARVTRILGLADTAQHSVGDREQQRQQLLELLGRASIEPGAIQFR
jgi:hypothetical protein